MSQAALQLAWPEAAANIADVLERELSLMNLRCEAASHSAPAQRITFSEELVP